MYQEENCQGLVMLQASIRVSVDGGGGGGGGVFSLFKLTAFSACTNFSF